MRKVINLMLTSSIVILLSSCTNSDVAIIKGELCGMKNKLILLEEIAPGGLIHVDSVRSDRRGRYSFKYKFNDNTPVFLMVRHEDDYLTLLASPGETIKVSSVVNLHRNYHVSGSTASEQIRELSLGAAIAHAKIDSLYRKYNEASVWDIKNDLEKQISSVFVTHKKSNIEFLVKNPKSLVSIYALYQRLPNGLSIFNEKDYLYYSMIADSISSVYPKSAHVVNLVKSVNTQSNIERFKSLANVSRSVPNIQLPDLHGNIRTLDELQGKTILLSFWSSKAANIKILNAELKELYAKYKDKGLEVYQVSLDVDQSAWVNSVIAQNIPWISVRDVKGSESVSARTYQIQSIPTNYIISKDGDVVGKNLWGNELEAIIADVIGND